MDKETLSNYGWIVICILVLSVMIALATPFGQFVAKGIKSTTQGLFDVNKNAMNSTGLINIGNQSFDESGNGGQGGTGDQGGTNTLPEVGKTAEEYTWEEIKAISEAGKGDEYFNLGDIKTITTTDGKTIVMEVVAFNADSKSDGTGTAGITWMSKDIVATRAMNSTDNNANGWGASEMRTWLQGEFYNTLPTEVKNNIVYVDKTYLDYTTASTKTSSDNVWIPSFREVMGVTYYENAGTDYSDYFVDNISRKKQSNWWLRTALNTGYAGFYVVYTYGSSGGVGNAVFATVENGIIIGFCT